MITKQTILMFLVVATAGLPTCRKKEDNTVPLTIKSFTPTTGAAGTIVEITGTGFSTTLAHDTVRFNGGFDAVITTATPGKLTVTVPQGATTGKILVKVKSSSVQSVTSATDFTVPPALFANFTSEIILAKIPARVKFTNTSTEATGYEWKFSDGRTFIGTAPVLPFFRAGTYTVQLTAKKGTATHTTTKQLVIAADPELVADYAFDNSIADSTGNGRHGIAHNLTAVADRHGRPNAAYGFNGTSSYVELPEALLKNTGQRSTISLWFQTNNPEHVSGIFGYQGSPAAVAGEPQSGYTPSVYIGTDKQAYGKFWLGVSPMNTSPISNNWHHLVVTGDETGQLLYLDGDRVTTSPDIVDNATLNMKYNQLGLVYLGGSWSARPATAGWHYLLGNLDDVRIYKRKLTQEEVVMLSNE